jgi:stress response protein SCP2
MPEYEKEPRFPLIDDVELTTLGLGTEDDMWEIFSNLLSSKTSISSQDANDIATIVTNYGDFYNHLPNEILLKENVAFLCRLILNSAKTVNADAIQKYFKTATDVLRLITIMSDGDVSLAVATRFRKLKRSERRLVMDLLSGCGRGMLEDMYRYRERWLRVGEIVHPYDFKDSKYIEVREAFLHIRKGDKPLFFGGKVEEAIKSGDVETAAMMLVKRPGEFARHLDKKLRETDKENYVLNLFTRDEDQVSIPVLLNLAQHFKDRCDESNVRVVMPKGQTAKAYTIDRQEKPIAKSVCDLVVRLCEDAIVRQCFAKEPMGKVYIDPEFKNYVMPFSQRSASTSVHKMLTRGSRIKVKDDADVIRGFVWWTNTENSYYNRVDIDLSASFYDENWGYLTRASWTQLRDRKYQCYHSGDRTNGGDPHGKGVAEFIDFKLSTCADARYVVFTVHSYNGQPFDEIGNVRFGWMEREDMDSGEIFEPKTVDMAVDLNAKSTQEIPVVFDLKTKEFVWCDLSGNGHCGFRGNSIECNLKGTIVSCYAAVNLRKPSLYDAIALNAVARGVVVNDRNEADVIFSNDTSDVFVTYTNEDGEEVTEVKDVPKHTAYELDYYMAHML